MSLASVFNIAGSGMSAQSTRLNTVASNIANAETVSSSVDKTYRARHPVFSTMFQQAQGDSGSLFADQDSSGAGVQVLGIVEDQSSLMPRYERTIRPRMPTATCITQCERGRGNGRHDFRQPCLPDQRGNDEYRQTDDAEGPDPGSVSGVEHEHR